MKSILQTDGTRCFVCGSTRWLEVHHVFGGALRSKSERYGLVVRLCHFCHNEPPRGVHQSRALRLRLQAYAQKKAMEHYGFSAEEFRQEFYKNYL